MISDVVSHTAVSGIVVFHDPLGGVESAALIAAGIVNPADSLCCASHATVRAEIIPRSPRIIQFLGNVTGERLRQAKTLCHENPLGCLCCEPPGRFMHGSVLSCTLQAQITVLT
jgi:hypothetical protein